MSVKNITELWDSQKRALEAGLLLKNDNFVIIAPTASGKTLNAEFAMLQTLRRDGKCVYLVPLSVLKTEKQKEFSYLQDVWGYKITAKGDWKNSDIVITTFESFHKAALLNPASTAIFDLAIVDEFHILYDQNRGFNLEKALTLLRESNTRVICLSATFEDKEEIQGWLNSELTIGKERTVPLEFGKIDLRQHPSSRKMRELYSWLLNSSENYPILFFCSTRDSTRSRATALCKLARETVHDIDSLRVEMADVVSRTTFTSLEEELYNCLCKKIAFHHSGLDVKIREFVVEKFKNRQVNFLFATTGLAYGINFPAKSVILCDLTMYGEKRMIDIPVYLFLQMAGRAGRPEFGNKGYAYVVIKTNADVAKSNKLLKGEIEEAVSHIAVDDLFKKAVLEIIYSGKKQEDQIISFFENTFYNYQSTQRQGLINFDLKSILRKYLKQLMHQQFIEFLGAPGFRLTDLGEVTMKFLFQTFRTYTLEGFMRMNEYLTSQSEVRADFALIYKLSKDFEGLRTYKIPRKRVDAIENFYQQIGVNRCLHAEYSAYAIYYGWIENKPEYEIEEEFKVFSSAIKNVSDEMTKILDIYEELSRKKRLSIPPEFQDLKDRMSLGVKKEEIPFAKLRNIGRETVRKLSRWCNSILRRTPYNFRGDMLSILIQFYEARNRDDNFLLTTLANNIENMGPVRAGKIVDLVKSRIG